MSEDALLYHTFKTAMENTDSCILAYTIEGDFRIHSFGADPDEWAILLGFTLEYLDEMSKNNTWPDEVGESWHEERN